MGLVNATLIMKKKEARKIKQAVNRQRVEIVKNFAKHVVKPKPKYMPTWLWNKLVKLVLNV